MASNENGASSADPLVIFMPSGRRGRVPVGTPLLDAARDMGVEIESICGGKLTCGKCLINVENGIFQKHGIESDASHISPQSEEEAKLVKRKKGDDARCSCVANVTDDVLVFVPEGSRAQKQVIRKKATDRAIEINQTVRQVYVEVDTAELGEHRGDWGRLQTALKEQWELENLSIDLFTLRDLQKNLRKKDWKVTVTLWHDREVLEVRPSYDEGIYGLAVDIGSTTVAGYLCNLQTGEVVATESVMNPQITYGEDLMSRVSYAMTNADGTRKMHNAIIKALNKLATDAARQADIKPSQIVDAVFVGNTTMVHVLLNIDPTELGGAPFALANRDAMDVKARDLKLKLHPAAYVHVMPAEAGHVGADNVAAVIAEEHYKQDEIVLMVDVGTNAEITLGNREWMLSASSPTGPAFEGAQIAYGMRAAPGAIERVRIEDGTYKSNFRVIGEEKWSKDWSFDPEADLADQTNHLAAGICGSGIIEVIAELFRVGIVTGDGRFRNDLNTDRVVFEGRSGSYVLASAEQSSTGEPILVTQDDVRNIQLGKAALYAGAKLLMNQAKLKTVDRIVLAGAFGSFIDPKYAMLLGLIPNCELDKVVAVGNAAGDGARIALLNRHKRDEAQRIAHWIRYVETAIDPSFQDEFVGAIHIPHKTD
ncbi:MAG: ASKHA domain-containing protein, partial [Candidatus Promineifilaceae bacterium]